MFAMHYSVDIKLSTYSTVTGDPITEPSAMSSSSDLILRSSPESLQYLSYSKLEEDCTTNKCTHTQHKHTLMIHAYAHAHGELIPSR